MEEQGQKRIALLIDAENTQYDKLEAVLQEISAYGYIITKRAYGDWTANALKHWPEVLNRNAIQPIQQFSYTKGKNSSDSALIIDAMDLLYTKRFDTFVVVSSDSDFTRLVTRLREDEIFVIGVGKLTTPESFVKACNDFLYLENLDEGDDDSVDGQAVADGQSHAQNTNGKEKNRNEKAERFNSEKSKIINKLKKAAEKYGDDEGWTEVSKAGSLIKRQVSSFDTRNYGFSTLVKLIEALNKTFEVSRTPTGNGKSLMVEYRVMQK